MKTKRDPRHQKRIFMMKNLFSSSFHNDATPDLTVISPVLAKKDKIDQLIRDCAPEWPIDQINKIDLAILRLSIHELLIQETPFKVVIDEAVEIAKEYGSESSPKFINGVLGSVMEKIK